MIVPFRTQHHNYKNRAEDGEFLSKLTASISQRPRDFHAELRLLVIQRGEAGSLSLVFYTFVHALCLGSLGHWMRISFHLILRLLPSTGRKPWLSVLVLCRVFSRLWFWSYDLSICHCVAKNSLEQTEYCPTCVVKNGTLSLLSRAVCLGQGLAHKGCMNWWEGHRPQTMQTVLLWMAE